MYFLLIYSPVGEFMFYLAICFHFSWVSKRMTGWYDRWKFNFIHCGFYLYFRGDNVKLLFMYLLAVHLSYFVKCLCKIFCSSLKWVIFFFLSCAISLYTLEFFIRYICQIFSLFVTRNFNFWSIFWRAGCFSFDQNQFINLFSNGLCHLCSKKSLWKQSQ